MDSKQESEADTKVPDPEVLKMSFEDFCGKHLGSPGLSQQIFDHKIATTCNNFPEFPILLYLELGHVPIWCFVKHFKAKHFLNVRLAGKHVLKRISEKLKEFNIVWPKNDP